MSTQLAHQKNYPQPAVDAPVASQPVPQGKKPLDPGKPVVPVESPAPRRGSWWGWVLAVVAGGVGWYFFPQWWPRVEAILHPAPVVSAPSGPRPVPVIVGKVEQRDFGIYLNALGTITAFNTVTIRSRVDGEVINVAFTEGQMVSAGDLLAEIDPRPYQMQRDQAQAQVARDGATLKLAEVTLSRQLELMKSQASTAQIVDQQIAQVDQAKAALQMNSALLDNAKLQLNYCRIVAPIDGRIGLRLVDRGNIIQASSAQGIAVITQLEPISLVFTIPQDDIPRVQRQIQESGELDVEAYDRHFQTQLGVGTLTAIDNQVDSTTGTLRLKATFSNENHALFPNQFVNARLRVETISNALVIPSSALQRGANETYVYVVKSDNTVELRKVVVGPSEGGETTIQSGLAVGEVVVTNGLDKLRDGSKVTLPGENPSRNSPPQGMPPAKKDAA
ncbi:MAG TPA: efflux RND transporter periplasmic adaptor subunit [Planctomicrobium sp.]|nr:efflux RND transporter periplasmic adaptor subunit [Planctomicrobium sp.]